MHSISTEVCKQLCASSYVVIENEKHAEVHVGSGKEPEKNLQAVGFC